MLSHDHLQNFHAVNSTNTPIVLSFQVPFCRTTFSVIWSLVQKTYQHCYFKISHDYSLFKMRKQIQVTFANTFQYPYQYSILIFYFIFICTKNWKGFRALLVTFLMLLVLPRTSFKSLRIPTAIRTKWISQTWETVFVHCCIIIFCVK